MAKKLAEVTQFYPAAAGQGFIEIKGSYKKEQILLATNVTDNIIIYNFADPNLGAGECQYRSSDNVTAIQLDYDSSGMSSSDVLQVFVDDQYAEVDLAEALIDPVNKVRVSNPQNLIDTDFEYGLQPSKWETLELVNNIPSFYPTQSDYSISDIVSITSLEDSDLITVTTETSHGIPVGTPIDVRGLDSITAEGKYLISTVPTDTTFTYIAKSNQPSTKTISGPYTVVIPGEFYTSSDVKYSNDVGIATDTQSPSTITVQTDYVHGLESGTSLYLTNTIASRTVEITDTASSNAPDGRPYVDPDDQTTQSISIDSTLTETKEKKGVYSFKFNGSNVDVTNNKILWANSSLAVGDALLYVPPAGDTEIGGLQRFQIYYVKAVDSTGITLCETTNGNYNGNPVISITSLGTYSYGRAELLLVYEIKRIFRGVVQTQTGRACSSYPWYCQYVPNNSECQGYNNCT